MEANEEKTEEDTIVNMTRVDKLVNLTRRKKTLEAELKNVGKDIEQLWAPILADMARAGLRNISRRDGTTLIPSRDIFCSKKKGVANVAICRELEQAGLGWLVAPAYASGKLKEWIKEQEKDHGLSERGPAELLPETLQRLFNVTEKNSIVVRNAGTEERGRDDGDERTTGGETSGQKEKRRISGDSDGERVPSFPG